MAIHTLNDQSPADSTVVEKSDWLVLWVSKFPPKFCLEQVSLFQTLSMASFPDGHVKYTQSVCETFRLVCNVWCFFLIIIIISVYFLWISSEAAVRGWTWTVGMFRWVWQIKNECMNTRTQNWRLTLTGSILSMILTQFPALVWFCHSDILTLPAGY